MYKLDSVLNKLKWLRCHKIKSNQLDIYIYIYSVCVWGGLYVFVRKQN